MFDQIKLEIMAVVGAILLVIALGTGWYIHSLRAENATLTKTNTELSFSYGAKVTALTTCSESVDAAKKASDANSLAAKNAVEQAKKDAVNDYKESNSVLFKKPITPVITKDNVKNFGGEDKTKQLEDYLQTQQLINEVITNRKTVK